MGGTDEDHNLVMLTFKEHYLAHHLLARVHPDHVGVQYSFKMMANRSNLRLYGKAKDAFVKAASVDAKARWSDPEYAALNTRHLKNMTEEHKANIAKARTGTTMPVTAKAKISMSLSGRKRGPSPLCGKTLGPNLKSSATMMGKVGYNNGSVNKWFHGDPGPGWSKGWK
jgi:hypothetical protein